jgi:hypothetical protein
MKTSEITTSKPYQLSKRDYHCEIDANPGGKSKHNPCKIQQNLTKPQQKAKQLSFHSGVETSDEIP